MSDFDYLLEDLEEIKREFQDLDREAKKAIPTLADLDRAILSVTDALVNLRDQKRQLPEKQSEFVAETLNSFTNFGAIDIILVELLEALEGTEYKEEPFGEYLLSSLDDITDKAKYGGAIRFQIAGVGFKQTIRASIYPNELFGDIDAWADAVLSVRGDKEGDPIKASKRWAANWNHSRDIWSSIQSSRLANLDRDNPVPFWSIIDGGTSEAASMRSSYGGYPTPTNPPKRFISKSERKIPEVFNQVMQNAEKTFLLYTSKLERGIIYLDDLLERLLKWEIGDIEPTAAEIRKKLEGVYPDIQLANDDRILQAYRDVKQTGDIISLTTTKDGRVEMTGDYSLKRFRPSKAKLARALGDI